jgi:hypothetical protein
MARVGHHGGHEGQEPRHQFAPVLFNLIHRSRTGRTDMRASALAHLVRGGLGHELGPHGCFRHIAKTQTAQGGR